METETYYRIGEYVTLFVGVLFVISVFILFGLLVDKFCDWIMVVI